MNEEFIHYLWKHQLFFPNQTTTTNEALSVVKSGEQNFDSGPDFFNGRIKLGNTIWAGNIEIHINASDWYTHKHQHDEAYDNIILHVVYNNDKIIHRKNGEVIPTLELKNKFDHRIFENYRNFLESGNWIPCERSIAQIGHFQQLSWFDSLMVERLNDKASTIEEELGKLNNDFQEVFYRKLARNFGFKTNGDAFEALASSLPLKVLVKHKTDLRQIEAMLYGQAGLLSSAFRDDYAKSLYDEYQFLAQKYNLNNISRRRWKFMRMRPSNFPTIRISQFSQVIYKSSGLINQILESTKLEDVIQLFTTETSSYWTTHFRFDKESPPKTKKIGLPSIRLLLINTVIPFLFVYSKVKQEESFRQKAIDWLEKLKAEDNTITRKFSGIGLKPVNAMQSQALLQLKLSYCDYKRCLECRFGYELIKSVS